MSVVVKIDQFGKIFIPKKIRGQLPAQEFEIIVKDDVVKLIPIRHPSQLFGSLRSLNITAVDEIHGEEHEFDA